MSSPSFSIETAVDNKTYLQRMTRNRELSREQENVDQNKKNQQIIYHKNMIDAWLENVYYELVYTDVWKQELDQIEEGINEGKVYDWRRLASWEVFGRPHWDNVGHSQDKHSLPNIERFALFNMLHDESRGGLGPLKMKIDAPTHSLYGCNIELSSKRYSTISLSCPTDEYIVLDLVFC